MGEHADRPDGAQQVRQDDDETRAMPPAPAAPASGGGDAASSRAEGARRRRSTPSMDWRKAKEQIVALLAGVVRWLGVIFALILVLHVIFVIGEANPDNSIATFVREWSDGLVIGFQDLFTPDDTKLRTLVNFGLAALFWLVVSAVVAKIIRRIGDSIDV